MGGDSALRVPFSASPVLELECQKAWAQLGSLKSLPLQSGTRQGNEDPDSSAWQPEARMWADGYFCFPFRNRMWLRGPARRLIR